MDHRQAGSRSAGQLFYFHGTRRFVTVLTTAFHWSLKPVHTPYRISLFYLHCGVHVSSLQRLLRAPLITPLDLISVMIFDEEHKLSCSSSRKFLRSPLTYFLPGHLYSSHLTVTIFAF